MPDLALQKPKEISAQRKKYAFERSLGFSQREACRRAEGDPDNGTATKWERSRDVQAWIGYFRQADLADEMLREKRIRIEEALNSILYGDGSDFPHTTDAPPLGWPERLNAAGQLRDMNGFRAARKTELTGKGGGPMVIVDPTKLDNDQLLQFERILASATAGGHPETGAGGDPAPHGASADGSGADTAQPSLTLPDNGR